jgi:hypothetical protein
MKMRFSHSDNADPVSPARGGAPVGILQELCPVERTAIVCLRVWCEGSEGRDIIIRDFCHVMGSQEGMAAGADLDALLSTILGNARRPIMRHGSGCSCFGGDESAFAQLIAAAAQQDRDDAMLFAGLLVNGHATWAVVQLALDLGQVFLRLARLTAQPHAPEDSPNAPTYRH